jgi:nitronate monooxygenase
MPNRLDLRMLDAPIVQAGMGSVARHELAAAVSQAGGLGTVAGVGADIAAELRAVRTMTDRPVAVNLLLPFLRPGDAEAAAEADVVVTFWGTPRRMTPGTWIHQCGSVEEALEAVAAGVDGVIAQGVEAGGHVRGTTPMLELVERVRKAVDVPVLGAGGVVDADGVADVLAAGAVAAVVGTRFLLSIESRAHPAYKQRCLDADRTILTELFGLGWPDAPHRVIPNDATRRWLRADPRGPRWIRTGNRVTRRLTTRIPLAVQEQAAHAQRPWFGFLGPQPPTAEAPDRCVDAGPLYAGEGVTRIAEVRPAAELVDALTP